jgi:hypothetical protein
VASAVSGKKGLAALLAVMTEVTAGSAVDLTLGRLTLPPLSRERQSFSKEARV